MGRMQRSLTNYHIKLLAAAFMVVDHVGAVLFPQIAIFRDIGRLSFPLFVWLLAQGEAHTQNVWRYALRLLLWGAISQPLYVLTFQAQNLNILFTLLLGLTCLRLARSFPQFQLAVWIGGAALAEVIGVDYGSYGIVIVGFISQIKPRLWWWASWGLLHLIILLVFPERGSFQFPAVFAPLILQLTNHDRGAKARWFYLFYPLHMLIIHLIRVTNLVGL